MALSRDEVYAKVKGVLVDALGVDDEEIKPDAVIRDDLGAESIDFLDIQFRLEKAFNIKIPKGDMFPENLESDPRFVQDGKVTPEGIAELKKRMPQANFTEFERDPELEKMSRLFTVSTIVNYIMAKIGATA